MTWISLPLEHHGKPDESLGSAWNISPATYRFWRDGPRYAYQLDRGNAKARRRWRRRDIPNSQQRKP